MLQISEPFVAGWEKTRTWTIYVSVSFDDLKAQKTVSQQMVLRNLFLNSLYINETLLPLWNVEQLISSLVVLSDLAPQNRILFLVYYPEALESRHFISVVDR